MAFTIFLLTTFFKGISREMIEAARVDGCWDLRILTSFMIPLSVPALITITVLNFSSTWNDLLYGTVFLQKATLNSVMMVVAGFKAGKYLVNFVYIFTSLTILVIPVILIYLFGQKYFVAGIMSGAIKE